MESEPSESGNQRSNRSIIGMIPNMITISALCCGLSAIRFGLEKNWAAAITFIFVAMVFDATDGAVARALKASTKLGAKLDSISDFICFGVAPAIITYLWILKGNSGKFGWIAVMVFCVCNALRLSRFQSAQAALDPKLSHFFVGVPTPAGAALLLMPMMAFLQFGNILTEYTVFIVGVKIWAICIGILMISRLPTYSIRSIRLPRKSGIIALVLFGAFAGALITETWITLLLLCLLYMASLYFSFKQFKKTSSVEQDLIITEEEI
jgi:CDP-diacylglycerol--serine O-phosphatidyltransferase